MPLIVVVLILIVIGILLWLLKTYIPMDTMIWRIIIILVIFAVVVWILQLVGLWNYIYTIRIGGK